MIKLIDAGGHDVRCGRRRDVSQRELRHFVTQTGMGVNAYAFIDRNGRLTRLYQGVSRWGGTMAVLEETPVSSTLRGVSLAKGV